MRQFVCMVVSLVFAMGGAVAAEAPQVLKIPDGTALRLALTEAMSSATNQVDNPVHFEVLEDVKVGGVIAIPKGATAVGHVVEAEPRKRMGRAGKLNFTVDHVKAPDGSNVRLRASSTRKGEDKTGTVIVGAVILSPLFLIMRGKDINIPKGTEIPAYVDGDREVALASRSRSVECAFCRCRAIGFCRIQIGSRPRRYYRGWKIRGDYAFDCAVGAWRTLCHHREGAFFFLEEEHDRGRWLFCQRKRHPRQGSVSRPINGRSPQRSCVLHVVDLIDRAALLCAFGRKRKSRLDRRSRSSGYASSHILSNSRAVFESMS